MVEKSISRWWRATTSPIAAWSRVRAARSGASSRKRCAKGAGRELVLDQAERATGARGRRRERVDAAARAAVDFHTWRALAPLGDADAAELAAGLVELAAGT
jgi:hypothetical protein